MRTITRAWASLAVILALIAAACSGGEDTTTPSYTVPPGFGSEVEEAIGEALEEMVEEMLSPPTALPPSNDPIGYSDPIAAIVGFWEATYTGDWNAAYRSAAPQLAAECDRPDYDRIAASLASDPPAVIEFSPVELRIVNDLAFGSFELNDGIGRLPIEGLLATSIDGAWYAHVNPCEALDRAAGDGPAYPLLITTTTEAGAEETASTPDEATTTTTTVGSSPTTTVPAEEPPPVPSTTTTIAPAIPLTAADKAEIELVIRQFIQADAQQDWISLHGSVPPLFGCTPTEMAAQQAPFHYSPTDVSFGPFTIDGNDDVAVVTFDVTYADTGETLSIVEFGAWEWGGVWYAAIEPCGYSDYLAGLGYSNTAAIDNLNASLALARELYVEAGDYDIPLATLQSLEPGFPWVATSAEAENGAVAFVNDGQRLLLLTQSLSGKWYCIAEEAGKPAVYSSAAYAATIDTFAGCKAVTLSEPWGPPVA